MSETVKQVLDKGFIRLSDFMGGDAAVVNAARVSFGAGSKGEEKDRKLIAYLLAHEHLTPFEHAVFQFHVKCPLFVMRQWIRHRSSAYNEISARYTEAADEFYVPQVFRAPDAKNKQSSSEDARLDQEACRRLLMDSQKEAYRSYQALINAGVARELARLTLPVSLYTQFYWTVSARNLLHFIGLRADAPAQWEIQRYAEAAAELLAERMPWTWQAYLAHGWGGRRNAKIEAERSSLAPAPGGAA